MANPVTIYGIKNCDTMAKARAWLDDRGVAYAFNDYRVEGIERDTARGMGRQGRLGEAAQPVLDDVPRFGRQGQAGPDARRRRSR